MERLDHLLARKNRLADANTSAAQWRRVCAALLCLLGVAVAGLVWLSLARPVRTHVVEIGSDGGVRREGPVQAFADLGGDTRKAVVRSELSEWIRLARAVPGERQRIDEAVAKLNSRTRGEAATWVEGFFRERNPVALFGKGRRVEVVALSVIAQPGSPSFWDAIWTEKEFRVGGLDGVTRWRGVFETEVDVDGSVDATNPLGVFVTKVEVTQLIDEEVLDASSTIGGGRLDVRGGGAYTGRGGAQ